MIDVCLLLTPLLQIFPTAYRARGLNFAASGGSVGSVIATQIWPVGQQNIGARTYFVFMAINLVCIPIVYFFYPETKHRSLEDMEVLFNSKLRTDSVNSSNDDHVTASKVVHDPK
jgi:hypothetical protein